MEEIKKWASELPVALTSLYGDLSSEELDLTERVSQAGFHTFHSARLWFFLIFDLVRFLGCQLTHAIVWLFHLVRPLAIKGAVAFQKLDLFTQLSIGGGLILVVLLWLTKRWIVRRRFIPRMVRWYRQKRQAVGGKLLAIQAKVGEHSRVLAAMLPHLAMIAVSALLIYLVPQYLAQIVNAWPLYALGVVWPIVSCTRAIIHDNHMKMSLWLEYAIVAYFAIFISQLPFSQTAISFTPLFSEVRFFFILWLLLPITRGSHLTFRKVLWALQRLSIPGFYDLPVPPSPAPAPVRARARASRPRARGARGRDGDAAPVGFMGKIHNVLNTIMTYGQRVGRVGPMLVETLVLQGICTREFGNRVLALRRDNVYQLVIFTGALFTPVSSIGYLALGILFPMRQSILMLADEEMPRVKFWLQYWTMLALLSPVYTQLVLYFWFVPLKGFLTLAGILALQFTDFPLEPMHEVFAAIITIFERIFRPQVVQRRVRDGAGRRGQNPDAQERNNDNVPLPPPVPDDFVLGQERNNDNVPLPPPVPDDFVLGEPLMDAHQSQNRPKSRRSVRKRRRKNKSSENSTAQVEKHKQGGSNAPVEDGVSGLSRPVSPAALVEEEGKENDDARVEVQQQGNVVDDEQHDFLNVVSGEPEPANQDEGSPLGEVNRQQKAASEDCRSKGKDGVRRSSVDSEVKHSGDEQSENPEVLGSESSDSEYVGDLSADGEPMEGAIENSKPVRRSKRVRQKRDGELGEGQ